MSAKRPHIIIFNPDQWRGDALGFAGDPAALTPNLDQLVQTEAIGLTNAYCQNPVCTPSRCSFMSGWYPHVAGHRSLHHMMHPHEPVLLRTLKQSGYFVYWGGKNDLIPGNGDFSDYCDMHKPFGNLTQPDGTSTWPAEADWRGDPASDTYYSFFRGPVKSDKPHWDREWGAIHQALEFIGNHKEHAGDKPLCIYLPLGLPHPTYEIEQKYYDQIDPEKLPPRRQPPEDWSGKPQMLQGIQSRQQMHGWTEERWTDLRRTYYAMCTRVDDEFGMIVRALKDAELYDDSLLFLFADHGDYTGDYGIVEKNQNTFEDPLSRVPFVVKPPKGTAITPGPRDSLVELIDMCATVEDLAGIEPPHHHFGKSLRPLFTNTAAEHRDAVFCEGGRRRDERAASEDAAASEIVPTGAYYPRVGLQAQHDSETFYHNRATMIRTRTHKYVRRTGERDELYDLVADPEERVNRIGDPALATMLAELKERMLDFYLETSDVVRKIPDPR